MLRPRRRRPPARKGVRSAHKMQVGPRIPVGIQLAKAGAGPASGPDWCLSHLRLRLRLRLGCGATATAGPEEAGRGRAELGAHLRLYPIILSLGSAAQPIYTRFPIIFSSFFCGVTIGFIPTRTAAACSLTLPAGSASPTWSETGFRLAQRCKLDRAFLSEYSSYKRLKLAQLLG